MAKRPRTTLRHIASALNVSPGTVSRSLRETPGVHPEMRERVRAMAESMGYVARAPAVAVEETPPATEKRVKIGVVVGDNCVLNAGTVDTSYVAYHFLTGLGQAAAALDATLSVAFLNATTLDADADPLRELPFLHEVDGVVLIYPLPEPFVAQLIKYTNVVSIEHAYPALAVDVVGPAQSVDVMRALERLHQMGHRRIGYTADDASRGYRLPQGLRFGGYLSGLRRLGLEYRQGDVFGIPGPSLTPDDLVPAVVKAVRHGLTALVCSTDRQAYRLRDRLRQAGIEVPKQLSIIGIGGVTPAEGAQQLTMYRTPYETLGLAAVSRLQQRAQGSNVFPVYMEYPGAFIEGSSAAPPPGQS